MKKREKLAWIIPDSERYGAFDIIEDVFRITVIVLGFVFKVALGAFVLNIILFLVAGFPIFTLPLAVLILAILIVIITTIYYCVSQGREAREKNRAAREVWAEEAVAEMLLEMEQEEEAELRRKAEQEEQARKKEVDMTCRTELDLALQKLTIHLDLIDRIITPKESVIYIVSHDTAAVERSLADMEACKIMIASIIEKEIL